MEPATTTRRLQGFATLLSAAVLSVGFYALISLPFFAEGQVVRYTTGHPIEYATVFLFFWGMAELVVKSMSAGRERTVLRRTLLAPVKSAEPIDRSADHERQLNDQPARIRHSLLGRRLREGLAYVREKQSAEGLEDHLRYLAELDADASHRGFALVRFIAWAIPILGFLGTVIGITIAIANISPGQLEQSLGDVTSGLAVAFDTTALSLTLSMVLLFANFLTERSESGVLTDVENQAHSLLARRFTSRDRDLSPYLSALETMTREMAAQTQTLVQTQVDLWQKALAGVASHHQAVAAQLAEQLQMVGRLWSEERAGFATLWQQEHQTQKTALTTEWQQHAELLRSDREQTLAVLRAETASRSEDATRRDAVLGEAMGSVAARLDRIETAFGRLTEQLVRLSDGDGRLAESQSLLAENLRLLRQTGKMDETFHSLTAAMHLLTSRVHAVAGDQRAA